MPSAGRFHKVTNCHYVRLIAPPSPFLVVNSYMSETDYRSKTTSVSPGSSYKGLKYLKEEAEYDGNRGLICGCLDLGHARPTFAYAVTSKVDATGSCIHGGEEA